ncbi:hypothetical protein D3C84_1294380 [compost metagenome]
MSISSSTVSSFVRAGAGSAALTWVPTKISLSDDAAVQYAMLKVGISAGSTTTSFSLNGWVSYTMDEAR